MPDSTEPLVDPPETYPIRSPLRPFPRAAREALHEQTTIIQSLVADPDGRNGGVIVEDPPSDELLEKYDLTIDLPPHKAQAHTIDPTAQSIWMDDRDRLVVIHPDRTEIAGRVYDIAPEEARERAEAEMTRLA